MECTAISAPPSLHRAFEALDEEALATNLGERRGKPDVALRLHGNQVRAKPRMQRFEAGRDVLGLPEREQAATGRDANSLHRAIINQCELESTRGTVGALPPRPRLPLPAASRAK